MIMIFVTLVYNNDIFKRFLKFFFKIFIFWVVSGVIRQKMVQNDKNLCPSRSISLELMVDMCKMMISPGVFFIFSKLLKVKKRSKMTKILPVAFHISGTIHHMIVI